MTRIDLRIRTSKRSPDCWGVGFIAMDLVEGQAGTFAAPGGSCGNVMALLVWMGWRAAPVARLGVDAAGSFIREGFRDIGVGADFLSEEASIQTPLVVQRFVKNAEGQRTHRFSLTCPECGGWLPRYRAITLEHANRVIDAGAAPKAYYFDRVSPAALKLAEWARKKGALIVFEPSSIGEERRFQRAVELCHVLKYSHDGLGHVPDLAKTVSPRIVIETRGKEGLRARWRSRWSHLPAFDAPRFVDAAGSGDWCTAGLIHTIAQGGASELEGLSKDRLDAALRFGQALAAINCGFEGARGAMMALSHAQMNKALAGLSCVGNAPILKWNSVVSTPSIQPNELCGICSTNSARGNHRENKRGRV